VKSLRRIPIAYWFLAAFVVVAPLSLSTKLEGAITLKYLRLSFCILGALLAVTSGALSRLGPASITLMIFSSFYMIAAVWSEEPLVGVAYKALFFCSILLGGFTAVSTKSIEDMRTPLRFLVFTSTIASLVVLYQYRTHPVENVQLGRLSIYGINANVLGLTAAVLFLVTFSQALWDSRFWRGVAVTGAGSSLIVLIASASRASLAMALVGAAVQLVPAVRRPGRLLSVAVFAAMVLVASSIMVQTEALERMTSSVNTRAGMWQVAMRLFSESPVLGKGWVTSGRSTGNLHSLYLQILVETGIIGAILFLVFLVSMFSQVFRCHRIATTTGNRYTYYFALSLVAGVLMHGLAESATLTGTTCSTIFLGFGVGILDRLRVTGPADLSGRIREFVEKSCCC